VLYLLLKVASSVGMGLILKRTDTQGLARLPIIRINYAAAAVLAFVGCIAMNQQHISRPTVVLAVITGAVFVAGILFWIQTIRTAGLALSVVAMRTAIVIPVLASVIIWHEQPTTLELAGVAVALLALGLVLWDMLVRTPRPLDSAIRYSSFDIRHLPSAALWLAGLFLVDGLVMVPAQIFRQQMPQNESLPFQAVIFISAFFITTILYYFRKPRATQQSLNWGALLGAANLGNYLFLVMALTVLPGVVVYPVIAAGEVGLMALAGVFIWKEKVGVRSWIGIALAVCALILIQLGRAAR
jgi:drug/metabolite transporter (DMT)-like permease